MCKASAFMHKSFVHQLKEKKRLRLLASIQIRSQVSYRAAQGASAQMTMKESIQVESVADVARASNLARPVTESSQCTLLVKPGTTQCGQRVSGNLGPRPQQPLQE